MARRLISSDQNALKIQDNMGGGDIVLYYRTPTTKERTGYSNASVMRKKNKVTLTVGERRQEYGLKILTGFRDGDFTDEKGEPISGSADSENYRPDWKKMVAEHASDLVQLLAAHVFEGSAEIAEDDAEEDAEKN